MLARSWFDALKSCFIQAPVRRQRRAAGQHGPAVRRLRLETLEDRRLLAFLAPVSYAISPSPPDSTVAAVLTADFNGDGRLDLTVANSNYPGSVSVLLGNADGTFQPALTSATGTYWGVSLAVGDFNADSKLDVAIGASSSYTTASVSVLLGNGDGTFQFPTSTPLGSDGAYVAVGDFNDDGKLDLGVASNVAYQGDYSNYFAGTAAVLLGNGDGSFATPITRSLGGGYHMSAAVADFNGDGKLDFATASWDYSTVSLLLGNGTGTLGAPTYFSTGEQPSSVAAGDVNGDGNIDLVTANPYGSNVSVLLGNGLGDFGAAQYYAAGGGGGSVVFGDFNLDGNLDIADPGTVLLGTGNGTFRPPLQFAGDFFPVAAGDFNGDGWLDAATANDGSEYTVSVLINDNAWPPLDAPSVSINDVTVTEGNTGTVNATFTVSLSAAYAQPVTVHYATADGTATAGSDCTAGSGDVIFAAGQTTKSFTIAVLGDRLGEPNESFFVNLSTADGFIGDGQGVGTILDDEPRISINNVTVTEGNTGSVNATFAVSLSAVYDQDVTVHFVTANGSAAAGSDYTAGSGTVTIAAGLTSQTFTVAVLGDRSVEPTETLVVNLSAATNGLIADGQGIGIILDNEPRISISDVTRAEGQTGQTTLFTFTVTLSAAYDQNVTMSFRTVNDTAKANQGDYIAKTGTLTFAPGETNKTITIEVKGDSKKEANETFYLDLFGNSTNSLITKNRGIGTILNDD
jgi:hypothetical protein